MNGRIVMNGRIIEYNPFNKRGKISGDGGECAFDASQDLADALSKTIIPPAAAVAVTYEPDGAGGAINVVLSGGIDIAASAEN
jgi:ABC-type phosphate transport system substrate-binding protein